MPRFIPIQLQDHLDQPVTTTCYLLRVVPNMPGFAEYGVTTCSKSLRYDDGDGELLYNAPIGTQPSALQGSSSLGVDNAEATSLMPEYDIAGLSEVDIRAGVYDFANFHLYLVNYEDLSQGHVHLRSGTLGRIKIDDDGLSFVNELRGYAAELRQSVCQKDSLSCRAIFGSQPIGSSNPGPQERFPCGFDATTLLVSATVISLGPEPSVSFSVGPDSSLDTDSLVPGMVFWVTGANAGKSNEIGSNNAAGDISLAHETAFPIQIGDNLFYREDCSKLARDDSKGCRHWFGDEWVNHFRGEPDIPIGDAGAMETPGASSPPGGGGYTFQPVEDQ